MSAGADVTFRLRRRGGLRGWRDFHAAVNWNCHRGGRGPMAAKVGNTAVKFADKRGCCLKYVHIIDIVN